MRRLSTRLNGWWKHQMTHVRTGKQTQHRLPILTFEAWVLQHNGLLVLMPVYSHRSNFSEIQQEGSSTLVSRNVEIMSSLTMMAWTNKRLSSKPKRSTKNHVCNVLFVTSGDTKPLNKVPILKKKSRLKEVNELIPKETFCFVWIGRLSHFLQTRLIFDSANEWEITKSPITEMLPENEEVT